jgi:hypothetical protein
MLQTFLASSVIKPEIYLSREPSMELLRVCGTSEWNLRTRWLSLDGIYTAAIYRLLFPMGYLRMESTEKMGHPGWNPLRSQATSEVIYPAAYLLLFPLGYLWM